ncbi:hypothetical protein [Catenuloplanes japonicus]|nr:hypothetical protein [Catenuloplanes japonicus]
MRAIRYDRYGPAEVLRPVDLPEPVAQRGQLVSALRPGIVAFTDNPERLS